MCCAAKDDTGSAPQVEFWEMHTGKRVWAWERPGCTVASAEFDLTDRGNEVVVYILFCESVGVHEALFLKANLETGKSEELFGLPRGHYYRPQICGDLFACCLSDRWSMSDILLINWRATEYVILSFENQSGTFGMFKGHVIVSDSKPGSTMDYVYIYSSLDLAKYWRPFSELNNWANNTDPRPDAFVTFTLPGGDRRTNHRMPFIQLFVTESPLKHQTYDLVIESTEFVVPPVLSRWEKIRNRLFKRRSARTTGWMTTNLRYQLTLASNTSLQQEPTLNSIFRYGVNDLPLPIHCMTTAGKYLLTSLYPLDPLVRRVDKAGLKHPFELSLPRPKEDPPYSWAALHAFQTRRKTKWHVEEVVAFGLSWYLELGTGV
ncbi:hypothetical protein B0H13DRAFT_1878025 [Mycena leptocephala]|nr:hypothetical protein B0H13DRAFT_1878025 [Mycena leptocephala]